MTAKIATDAKHGPRAEHKRGVVRRMVRARVPKPEIVEKDGVIVVKYGRRAIPIDAQSLRRLEGYFDKQYLSKHRPQVDQKSADAEVIIKLVEKWAGGKDEALDWFRSYQIPSFGDRTAEALVGEGKAAAVRNYIDRIALGGFA